MPSSLFLLILNERAASASRDLSHKRQWPSTLSWLCAIVSRNTCFNGGLCDPRGLGRQLDYGRPPLTIDDAEIAAYVTTFIRSHIGPGDRRIQKLEEGPRVLKGTYNVAMTVGAVEELPHI